jgi:carboxylesterase
MSSTSVMRNPHLEGSSFDWESGPVGLLLCHGFTATTAEVRLLAQALYAEGYSVSAPLLPGHGTTPEDCNRFSWQDWSDSLERAYSELTSRCKSVIAGGESLGALLVLHLAAAHPELKAVLCYAPALRLKLSRTKIVLLSLLAPFVTSIPKPASDDDNPWQGYGVEPLKGVQQLLQLQERVLSELTAIHQPILIMQGRLDPTVHPNSPQIIYDRVSSPVKQIHWLEKSTHCVILDKEHLLAADLTLEFLSRVLI